METETKNSIDLRRWSTVEDYVDVSGISEYPDVTVTLDELQAIVQLAYDQFGILAAPSYDVEAERAPELDPLQMIHDHVNRAHAQQVVNRSGVRALGFAAVHGVDL